MVRLYKPTDRAAVERICIQSGLKGRLENYFCDKELFANLWLSPFLDGEPESCWVAEKDGEIVGYLVASIKKGFRRKAFLAVLPHIFHLIRNCLNGKYQHHRPSAEFSKWLLFRCWREVPPCPKDSSNFHFNVTGDSRGATRIGDELMNVYFAALRDLGKETFYVHIFGMPGKRDLQFYRRIAFKVLGVKRCSLFKEPSVVASLQRKVPANDLNWREIKTRDVAKVGVVIVVTAVDAALLHLLTCLKHQALPPDEILLVTRGSTGSVGFSEAIFGRTDAAAPTKAVEPLTPQPSSDPIKHLAEQFGASVVRCGLATDIVAQRVGAEASNSDIVLFLKPDADIRVDLIAQVVGATDQGYSWGASLLNLSNGKGFDSWRIALENWLPPVANSVSDRAVFAMRKLYLRGFERSLSFNPGRGVRLMTPVGRQSGSEPQTEIFGSQPLPANLVDQLSLQSQESSTSKARLV